MNKAFWLVHMCKSPWVDRDFILAAASTSSYCQTWLIRSWTVTTTSLDLLNRCHTSRTRCSPTLCVTAQKEEKKFSDYALQFTKDRTILLAIKFHFLRVSCVYVSGKVPMFSNTGRVWRWGENRKVFFPFKPYYFCKVMAIYILEPL